MKKNPDKKTMKKKSDVKAPRRRITPAEKKKIRGKKKQKSLRNFSKSEALH